MKRDRLLAGALTRQKGDLKQLLKDWDRGKSGALTRVEFRMGVREDLGLHYLDSKYIDGWFDAIDKDGAHRVHATMRVPTHLSVRPRSCASETLAVPPSLPLQAVVRSSLMNWWWPSPSWRRACGKSRRRGACGVRSSLN